MKYLKFLILSPFLTCFAVISYAQTDTDITTTQLATKQIRVTQKMAAATNHKIDSTVESLQRIPLKYINGIENKVDIYQKRIINKTEKTLTKLAKWESKIHHLLNEVNPQAAERLFGNNQLSFATALHKFKAGENIIADQKARYDQYQDKLSINIKYLAEQKDKLNAKVAVSLETATDKLKSLNETQSQTDAIQQFIKERKKLLIDQSLQYIGNSKYLAQLDKEAYYYVETIKNYKEIFSDEKKLEQTTLTILNKIPAFSNFVQQNSMLASLFGAPSATSTNIASIAGLQTRTSVNALIQNQIAAGGPNAQAQFSQNIQTAQDQLNTLKDKIQKSGGNSSDAEVPNFKPNETKTKTFKQRLEFGTNLQSTKGTGYLPTAENIGLSLGYKLNDKSIIGLGASYKMGLGSINHIQITHQGFGLRSFIDWKLKKQFFVSGGFEMNYNTAFGSIYQLQQFNAWQQSGLVGITKKISVKTKWFKGTNLQLLYDILANVHVPVSQPVVFRVGYNF